MMMVTKSNDYVLMKGHAGNKTVCAMVSSLCVTLINYLKDVLHEKFDYRLGIGDFYIDTSTLSSNGLLLFNAFWHGIEGIAKDYPECLKTATRD